MNSRNLYPILLTLPLVLTTGCDRSGNEATAAEAHDHAEHAGGEEAGDHAGHDHEAPARGSEPESHDGHDHGGGEPAAGGGHDDHANEPGEEGHADEVRLTSAAMKAVGIRVDRVECKPLDAEVSAPARVGFNTEAMAHVGSLVSGRVKRIDAKLGQRVAAGDVLLTVESPELGKLQAEHLSAVSGVAASRPSVEIGRDAYQRARGLFDESQGISLTEVQRREAELKAAERELAMAEAGVTASANTLRLHGMGDEQIATLEETQKVDPVYEVTAPIDGTVVEREVTPGELVSPEDESLLVVADLSTVWVLIDVAEARLSDVGVGSEVRIRPAAADAAFSGTVTYVDPRVNERSRTARLRAEVDNPDGALRPGMFAAAGVGPAAGAGQPVLVVPASAVLEVEGGPSVFVPVPGEENTFARRSVSRGAQVGDSFPLLGGLEAGDELVVEGAFILKADLGKAGASHEH